MTGLKTKLGIAAAAVVLSVGAARYAGPELLTIPRRIDNYISTTVNRQVKEGLDRIVGQAGEAYDAIPDKATPAPGTPGGGAPELPDYSQSKEVADGISSFFSQRAPTPQAGKQQAYPLATPTPMPTAIPFKDLKIPTVLFSAPIAEVLPLGLELPTLNSVSVLINRSSQTYLSGRCAYFVFPRAPGSSDNPLTLKFLTAVTGEGTLLGINDKGNPFVGEIKAGEQKSLEGYVYCQIPQLPLALNVEGTRTIEKKYSMELSLKSAKPVQTFEQYLQSNKAKANSLPEDTRAESMFISYIMDLAVDKTIQLDGLVVRPEITETVKIRYTLPMPEAIVQNVPSTIVKYNNQAIQWVSDSDKKAVVDWLWTADRWLLDGMSSAKQNILERDAFGNQVPDWWQQAMKKNYPQYFSTISLDNRPSSPVGSAWQNPPASWLIMVRDMAERTVPPLYTGVMSGVAKTLDAAFGHTTYNYSGGAFVRSEPPRTSLQVIVEFEVPELYRTAVANEIKGLTLPSYMTMKVVQPPKSNAK